MQDTVEARNVEIKTKVFISYSRKDMAFADRLEAALKARGFEVLIDREEIYAFEDWWKRLQSLIGSADTVAFVLSPDAVASREALREVEYAASLNKRFAPIVCRRVEDSAVPEALRRLNFIFFDDAEQFEASADRLGQALQTDIAWIRRHTEFGDTAHRWMEAGRPGGMLLRPPVLDQAEAWLAFRPGGVPLPTAETQAFITQSRKAMLATQRLRRIVTVSMFTLLIGVVIGLVGWINQLYIADQWRYWTVTWPYMRAQVRPYVLSVTKERALKPGDSFKECAQDCPEMIVVPAGSFTMGGTTNVDQPQHQVTIAKPFAVAKYELTFADWDACVVGGGCNGYKPADHGWGRGQQPVINVNWDEEQAYLTWLSQVTGKTYRLLSEAEYEYAARAGTTTPYPWGNDIKLNGQAMADCGGCGSKWDSTQTAPVGSFYPNEFGLYDMLGNVREKTEDCLHKNYNGAPTDGSAWLAANGGDCTIHILRGGSWDAVPDSLRSAYREAVSNGGQGPDDGFRVARTLDVPALTEQQIDQIKRRQQLELCTNENNAFSFDLQIAGCTVLIQSGKLSDEELAAAYEKRGNAYSAKGDYGHAVADYNQAIAFDPKNAVYYDDRGVAYAQKKDYEPAITDYTQAIALDPKNAAYYDDRGIAYESKEDYARAIADFSEAITLDPKYAGAFNNRCYDNAIIGHLQAALADCNQSLQLRPNDAGTLDSRGLTYLKFGQFDSAIADYNAALKIDPKLASSLYGRGVAEIKKGRTAAGVADIAAAKAIQSNIAEQMVALGISL